MDLAETVRLRCAELGLAATLESGPGLTIHDRIEAPASSAASSSRELPKISVSLLGTLSSTSSQALPDVARHDLEVLATLGEGGMGRVFLARQHSLDREVAIKTVRDRATAAERAALLTEGAITGHLEHPSVVPVHALGTDDEGRPVLVMKRVDGVSWATLLEDPSHRLDAHLEILMQVCNAAHFAHSRGVVHRDIKPANVLIGRYGEVYLADWGIAARTDREWPNTLCGTPAFIAPEMVTGAAVDARTDVYLLGATLHQILTGEPRHTGLGMLGALISAAVSDPVAYPPTVPADLAALANSATSRDPEKRPSSAEEMRQALASYLRHKTSIALASSAAERLDRLRQLADTTDEERRELDVLSAETRFAVQQALEAWPENPVATRVARELEELLAARRTRALELEKLARDLDPGVSRVQRVVATGALAAVGLALSLSTFVSQRTITAKGLLVESLGPVAIFAVAALTMRRHLLRTAINRNAVALIMTAVLSVTTSRALGLLGGLRPAQILVYDSLLLAAVAALSAAIVFRWSVFQALLMLGAAGVAAAAPEQAMRAFSVGTGLGLLLGLGFTWTSGSPRS